MITLCAAIVSAAFAGCGDGTTDVDPRALPSRLALIGEASGAGPTGGSITCFVNAELEMAARADGAPDGTTTWQGTHSGHVGRTLRDAEGAGFAFDAVIGGVALVRIRDSGLVEVEFPSNGDAEGRFWTGLHRLEGRFEGDPVQTRGSWSCHPLDVETGYVDTAGVVRGEWWLQVP